jgi:hypothetical protein
MTAVFILLSWFGYWQSVYGYCLLKGFDVTHSELGNPATLYQWPPGGPSLIPDTQTWPTPQDELSAAAVAGPGAGPGAGGGKR